MKYKIIRYKESNFFLESKKDLFNLIDKVGRIYFTTNFDVGLKGNFLISSEKCYYFENNLRQDYYYYYRKYIKGVYILLNVYGEKVNLDELFTEYKQSRGLIKKKAKKNIYDLSSANSRKKNKRKFYSANNSFTKEYRDNITAKESNVKIRSSRRSEVKLAHVFRHEDSIEYRLSDRNWKSQGKKLKQWDKKSKKIMNN